MSGAVEETLMTMIEALKEGQSLDPNAVAKAVAGDADVTGRAWRRVLPHIKSISIGLARKGQIEILRKGKSVSPEGLKGIYRLSKPTSTKTII